MKMQRHVHLTALALSSILMTACGAIQNASSGSASTNSLAKAGNISLSIGTQNSSSDGSATSANGTSGGGSIGNPAQPYSVDMTGSYLYQDSSVTLRIVISSPLALPGASSGSPGQSGVQTPILSGPPTPSGPQPLTRQITVTGDCTAKGMLQDNELVSNETTTDGDVTIDNDFSFTGKTCTKTKLAVQNLLIAATYSATASQLTLRSKAPAHGSEIAELMIVLKRLPVVDPPPPPPTCGVIDFLPVKGCAPICVEGQWQCGPVTAPPPPLGSAQPEQQ